MKASKINEFGRSMIEMLGVLAIIGVLSVGAIAGYQKAMMKYKLNKYSEQLNQVVNSIVKHSRSFDNLANDQRITDYFIKMGEIPIEMIKNNKNDRIYDVVGGNSYIFFYASRSYGNYKGRKGLSLFSRGPSGKSSIVEHNIQVVEVCKNSFLVAKENYENILYVVFSNMGKEVGYIFAGEECTNKNACLEKLDLEYIHNYCQKLIGTEDWELQIAFK